MCCTCVAQKIYIPNLLQTTALNVYQIVYPRNCANSKTIKFFGVKYTNALFNLALL